MARVVWLSTVAASRRLKDELMARGFSEKFGCFHGGVRILWPGIRQGDDPYDHLLLLPVRIHPISERVRAERVAGLFCEMIAEGEDIRARLREVEASQRAEAPRRPSPGEPGVPGPSSATNEPRVLLGEPRRTPATGSITWRPTVGPPRELVPVAPVPPREVSNGTPASTAAAPPEPSAGKGTAVSRPPGPAPTPAATILTTSPMLAPTTSLPPAPAPVEPEPPADAITAGRAAVEPAQPARASRVRSVETTWSRLASDVVAAAELAEELEKDLESIHKELMDSHKAQRRAEQERDEAVEARFTARSVIEALSLAEACYPGRLAVLTSARASAEASPFRDPARIFEVLTLLAFFGRHDGDCEAALQKVTAAGARWRPRDSPDTTARYGGQRTWAGSDGTRKLFRRHITLGHGVDAQRCAQIYYDVAGDGRVEVAWLGEHRPTVSEDT